MQIDLRPLKTEDALVSYKWRNNPIIWKYTGACPDKLITPEIETAWIKAVMNRSNERRYAILADTKYVGNTYLTNITKDDADFHIFIGDTSVWGKGIATAVVSKVLNIAKNELRLKKVYLDVNFENIPAMKAYEKNGFVSTGMIQKTKMLRMERTL